jgi:hypothetical protein
MRKMSQILDALVYDTEIMLRLSRKVSVYSSENNCFLFFIFVYTEMFYSSVTVEIFCYIS